MDDDRNHGAHGAFDDRARDRSYEFWARTNAGFLAIVGVAAAAIAYIAWARRRER